MIKDSKYISFFFLCFFIFNFYSAYSQQIIELQGRVVDKQSGMPLSYTNIGISNSSLGTISNQKGEFRLILYPDLVGEKLVFSYLGYKTYQIPVADCLEKNVLIKLTVLPVDLKTINVKYLSPKDLIISALNSIPRNFLNNSVTLTTFYREEIKENDERIQFIEAVMQVYKGAYNDKKDKDRVRIIKAREQSELKPSVFFNYLYFVDGPYEALSLDIAKYPKDFIKILHNSANFLNPKHFKHYNYEFNEVVYTNKLDNNYVITFMPKTKKALLQGKIVLNKESLAFLSLEFFLPENRILLAQLINYDNEDYINSEGFYTKAKGYFCKVNFRKYNNRFLISDSKIDYRFQFINSLTNEIFEIANSIDFVVTKIDSENVEKFKQSKSIWRNVSLSKQLGSYDPEFWENYNIIKSLDED